MKTCTKPKPTEHRKPPAKKATLRNQQIQGKADHYRTCVEAVTSYGWQAWWTRVVQVRAGSGGEGCRGEMGATNVFMCKMCPVYGPTGYGLNFIRDMDDELRVVLNVC